MESELRKTSVLLDRRASGGWHDTEVIIFVPGDNENIGDTLDSFVM